MLRFSSPIPNRTAAALATERAFGKNTGGYTCGWLLMGGGIAYGPTTNHVPATSRPETFGTCRPPRLIINGERPAVASIEVDGGTTDCTDGTTTKYDPLASPAIR